ncbi:class I tRNA ligase family protein [Komagataeibacter kakiaceti]|uniref:class I tRNA ligase family protein n=1 Tax=Komagataeibacter kakiaceti TaxID=943261 RepID=UPI0038990454
MRFCICALTGLGRDVKLGRKRVEEYRSFMTKIWNAARFCEMNGVAPVAGFSPETVTSPLGRWILAELAQATEEATRALETFRFDEYAAVCYRFVWNCFCDWFLELAKPVLGAGDTAEAVETRAVAAHVLGTILRLLQPVTPFMTDRLWQHFGFGAEGSLMTAPWPQPVPPDGAQPARDEMEWLIRFITAIRTVRSEMNVPPSRLAPVLLRDATPVTVARAAKWAEAISRMARVSEVLPLEGEMPQGAAQLVVDEATLVIPLAGIIDLAQERQRLEKECAKVDGEIVKVERKLGNADFVARAKPEVVAENRERLETFQAERQRLQAALARIA